MLSMLITFLCGSWDRASLGYCCLERAAPLCFSSDSEGTQCPVTVVGQSLSEPTVAFPFQQNNREVPHLAPFLP